MRLSARPLCAALVSWAYPVVALGCSGPEAQASIDRARSVGWASFLLSCAALLLMGLRLRRVGMPRRLAAPAVGWLIALAAAHPALWISPSAGDCGSWRLGGSVTVTLLEAVVVGLAVWRPRTNR